MNIVLSMLKLRHLVRKQTPEHVLRLQEMTDETSIAAMQLLNLTYSLVFSARPALVPVVVFHVIKLTLEHGASVMSSVGFAVCAMILCGSGDTDIGLRYAELALDLYARFPVREWLPRVYAGVYGGAYACAKSPALSLAPLRHGHRIGLETGDTEVSK
jgi:predicted ATPase